MTQKPKISAFVVSYNRENIIHTCLSGLQFVDELILVDKSSTDRTVEIATPLVDKVVVIPWTPTADDTRQYAETLCSHEWILFLDDDECLNVEAIKFIERELANPRAKYYKFPLRHYICGIHSENAYYWPESHIRLYKKGAISFQYKIHDYIQKNTDEYYEIPSDSGPCIHHFSHKNVQEWIEKCNRYTSEISRYRMSDPGAGNNIITYAHRAIDRWVDKTKNIEEGGYDATAAVLRATYDIIDRLKCWEEENFIDGKKLFEEKCLTLEESYKVLYTKLGDVPQRTGYKEVVDVGSLASEHESVLNEIGIESKGISAIRDELTAQRESFKLLQRALEDERENHRNTYRILLDERNSNKDATLHLENQLKSAKLSNRELIAAYQSSFSWRITRPIRGMVSVAKEIKNGIKILGKRLVANITNVFLSIFDRISKDPNALREYLYTRFTGLYEISRDFKAYALSRESSEMLKRTSGYIPDEEVGDYIKRIAFENTSSPTVSIVIPAFGEPNLVLMLLTSIKKSESKVPFEIVLVNARETKDSKILKNIPGVIYIASDKKLSFSEACNLGIQRSNGEYIQIIHQDVQVQRFWLDSLLDAFYQKMDCGAVGSMILKSSGMLEHAGGIIFKDGTVCNYGEGDNPQDERYIFRRPVDFCSSASMLIKKSALEEVSLFSSKYEAGNFESIDLALRLREHGFNIYYEPLSVVTHFSGASKISSSELSITNSYQKNEKLFARTWQGWIRAYGKSKILPRLFSSFNLGNGKKRILLIDHYIPQYDVDAGSRTIWNYLETLASLGHQVIFWPQNLLENENYSKYLRKIGIEVVVSKGININFSDWLDKNGDAIDIAIISRPHVMEDFISHFQNHKNIRTIYYGHDIHFLRMEMEAESLNNPVNDQRIENVKALENSAWLKAHKVLYPSLEEVNYVKNIYPNIVAEVIQAFAFDIASESQLSILEENNDLIFVAGFGHPPNVNGAIWFLDKIWPKLSEEFPNISLNIVGSKPPQAIKKYASERIIVHGYVSEDELLRLYRKSRVAIAPLLSGGGIKGKIIEAMCYGVPVVTTRAGSQGFEAPEKIMKIGDSEEEFYFHVKSLLNSYQESIEQTKEALKYVGERFSKDSMKLSMVNKILN